MNKKNIGIAGVAYLAVIVFVFCLAPTGKRGMLSGRLTTVFDSVVVNGGSANVWGGTQTVGSSDRFGVAYRITEGTSTGHIDFIYAVSFDDSLTDKADVANWIDGDVNIATDFQTDNVWTFASLPATNTAAPWIRFQSGGTTNNATNTAVSLTFFKQ